MQKKQTVSAPKRGMNKDAHPTQLQNIEYIHAENINTDSEVGDSLNVLTEPSNSLALTFPTGYKVIGFKKDTLNEKTYYFLTNPQTKKSSIGYIKDLKSETYNEDDYVPCGDCEGVNIINSQGSGQDHQYVELIEDTCHSIGEGLNFDINFPIKFIEIKNEKLVTTLYWNDYLNKPRYARVSDLEYLKIIEVPCGTDIITNCIIVSKLLQFPEHTEMRIDPEQVLTGGNLKHGTYEFYGAYCDAKGNELTDYCTPTNPISIFDESNVITTTQTSDSFTNYSIKLKVKDLDKSFKYYKIVCTENNNIQNAPTSFLAEILPTTDDTLIYSSSNSTNDDGKIAVGNSSKKERVETQILRTVRPKIEKAKGEVAIAGKKFLFGLKYKEELNLQPIVNLFGSLLRWQTSIAKEDLYKSPIATSKYRGYRRDEVYPFGIRFLYKEGGKTAIFPLIGRPSNNNDTEIINDSNYLSINDLSDKCVDTERNKKWQYLNTAFSEGFCRSTIASNEVVKKQLKSCTLQYLEDIPSNSITLNQIGEYNNFKDWLEDNYAYVTNPENVEAYNAIGIYLLTYYPDHCTPTFRDNCQLPPNLIKEENFVDLISSKIIIGENLIENQEYIIFNLDISDDFTGTGFEVEGEKFYSTGVQPINWAVTEVEKIDETYEIYNELPIEEYARIPSPKFCGDYLRNESDGSFLRNQEIYNNACKLNILERDFSAVNTACNSAEVVANDNGLQPGVGQLNNVIYNEDANTLITNKVVSGATVDYKEILTFTALAVGETGLATIRINGVNYTNIDGLASTFHATHQVAIELSTGGILTVLSGNRCQLSNAVNGLISNVTITGDMVVTLDARSFNSKLHKNALYYKVDKQGRDKIVFEIVPNSTCKSTTDQSQINTKMRYNIFESCASNTAIEGEIYDINDGVFRYLDISTYPETFYIAIDTPLNTFSARTGTFCNSGTGTPTYKVVSILRPPCGCFDIRTRSVEYSSIDVTWDTMKISKKETYESTCTFLVPIVGDCDPQPYENGSFSYWESLETYPDNNSLYDSSNLKIKPSDLDLLKEEDKLKIREYYTDNSELDASGNYKLKAETRFNCAKIRHFKMPDNKVTPFITDDLIFGTTQSAESIIFPIGVTIDENVVYTMLDLAQKNGLITKTIRDSISGFEIVRGDNSTSKSVIANGIGFDLYKYNKNRQDYHYSNYPFNTLGRDVMHCTDSSRTQLIPHPFNSNSNNKYTVISPDLLYSKPQIPSEISLSGYQLGFSDTTFQEVKDHPKWTILGERSRKLAERLALAEVVLEIATKTAELGIQIDLWFTFGLANGSNVAGTGIKYGFLAIYIGSSAANAFVNYGKYRYQWMKTFRDLGAKYNFSSYGVGVGKYNSFLVNSDENSSIRAVDIKKHLNKGRTRYRSSKTGQEVFVNNFLREDATLITLGSHKFDYINDYKGWDNYDLEQSTASRTTAGQNTCEEGVEISKHVGSPYFTLKNYVPDQYGGIDSIKWKTTNGIFNLGEVSECKTIFGGTIFISRFSWKKKMPHFTTTAMGIPDKTPYDYSKYPNIGFPTYYCDYERATETGNLKGAVFPTLDSDTQFDCTNGLTGMYLKKPSKFYLYSYGVVDFLVESEINCNFRQGRKEPRDNFYPNVGDVVDWTQQVVVPINEPNTLFYDNVHSLPVSDSPTRVLDSQFVQKDALKISLQDNTVMYSEEDRNELDLFLDPWLTYKPLNRYEFPTSYGVLQRLQNLQGQSILGLFTDQAVIFNKVDQLADRLTTMQSVTGTGGIFASRPMEFSLTDLGFAGTQNTELANTPYGNFYVDSKRGKIYQIGAGGEDLQPISDIVQGKPSGMKNWFKEHLPFKILKQLPEIDIDNKFKGLGFNIWYDARFDRVFFTKKDAVVKKGVNLNSFTIVNKQLLFNEVEVDYTNTDLFEDASFTIAFKPSEGWISFYSFKPNYSVAHQDYFQTGLNLNESLWNHYLGNKSFQNFYGNQERFLIEYPVQAENARKQLTNLSFNLEARRWQSEWDYAEHGEVGFDKMVIYNNSNNSGLLNLVQQKSKSQVKNYPKTNSNTTQDVLYTSEEGKHNVNYFYNRVKNQDNNIPQWLWDNNMLNKTINRQAISFQGKRLLERLRGEYFIVRLINDTNKDFQIIFKNSINTHNDYN